MRGPTCIFWANLTPFSLQCSNDAVKRVDAQPLLATDCNIFPSNFVSGFCSNGAGAVMLARMGVKLEDYDLAHYLGSHGGGGKGGLGVCADGRAYTDDGMNDDDYLPPHYKARGGSANHPPNGDSFNAHLVAHEIGHQFGIGHTFAGIGGSCTPGNFNPSQGVELAGGRTTLSYAGVCASAAAYNSASTSR